MTLRVSDAPGSGSGQMTPIAPGGAMTQVKNEMQLAGGRDRVGSEEVPKRVLEFDEWVATLPKYFANGDIVMSHVLTVLSSTFPDGEDFFVRSVAAVKDEITD